MFLIPQQLMTKPIFFILILCGIVLQSCNTYKRSFGETFTGIDIDNYNKIYRLDLSNQDLKVAPVMLDELVELRMLNLSGNTLLNLEEVLEIIPNPEQLEVLILDSLGINVLPESILRFKNLKHLSLNSNPDINIEKTIASIIPLPIEFLNIQHNNLVTLPSKIADITALTAINISHNQISNPEAFQFLGELPNLHSLWLTHNNLHNLPKEIGLLTSLRNLYMEHNNLSSLPNSMANLNKVTVLHLGHNSFTQLPVQLTKMPSLLLLHINNCKIIEISEDFATSKYSLMSIILDNNKLSEKDKEKWRKEFSSFFMASFK